MFRVVIPNFLIFLSSFLSFLCNSRKFFSFLVANGFPINITIIFNSISISIPVDGYLIVFDDCENLSKFNVREFGDYKCLAEGAKYIGVWLETQPMGGEMYAKRDLEAALSNILIFIRYQRRDGR